MKIKFWLKKSTHSLSGKTVAISGSTGGIGQELCRLLVSLGADLVLLDRSQEKAATLEQELRSLSPDSAIHRLPMDLTDMDSVRHAAEQLEAIPLDALILNAGIYQVPRFSCTTGLDNVFQVNFAAPYYLARRLRPHLDSRGGRVVAVGSIAHNNAPTDKMDPQFFTQKKSSLVYGNSKRFLMFALYGLYEGAPGLAVTHPGITLTNISAHHPPWLFRIIKGPMKVIFMSPKKACLSILNGVFQDCGYQEWIGPRWFDLWGYPKTNKLNTCPPEEAAWIRERAEEIYHRIEKSDF